MKTYPSLYGPEVMPTSGAEPKQLVIFVHGYGANGNDLISLAENFSEALPDAAFISPDAPENCEVMPVGYQWFSLRSWDESYILSGLRKSAPILDQFIDECMERFKLDESKITLVGFSQGTMVSMHVALRRKKQLACVVGYSGALVDGENLSDEIQSKPPILLIHGMLDMVVPYVCMSDAERWLKQNNVSVKTITRPGLGHGIDFEGIEAAKTFMKSNL